MGQVLQETPQTKSQGDRAHQRKENPEGLSHCGPVWKTAVKADRDRRRWERDHEFQGAIRGKGAKDLRCPASAIELQTNSKTDGC